MKASLGLITLAIAMLAGNVNATYSNKIPPMGYGQGVNFDAPSKNLDADVKTMVKKMSLKQKIGQMSQLNEDKILLPDGTVNVTAVEYYAKTYYIGSYLNNMAGHNGNLNAAGYATNIETLSDITVKAGGLPILYGLDSVHGAHYVANATIFPHGIAQAASFDPSVAYNAAEITAKDSRGANIPWTFAPILDLGTNKQWPRIYENFGEDPYLQSVMAAASVRGFQGNYKTNRTKIAACAKHFLGYGATHSGEDRDSSWIPDRFLYDYYVPPFQAAYDAGAATTMESYIDINGEPVVGSTRYLKTLMRDDMGFNGMLVTDWAEIENLYTYHQTASSPLDAVFQGIGQTSTDMSMIPEDTSFPELLLQLVQSGKIPESRIDESAGRVLQLKKDLGLLAPNGWKADKTLTASVGQTSDQEVAIDAARQLLTLTKNNNTVLPIKNANKVLVVGPTANAMSYLAGGWTIYWQGATVDGWQGAVSDEYFYGNGVDILDGIKKAAPSGTTVDYVMGVDIWGNVNTTAADVASQAADADYVILCIGEHPYAEAPGNIHDLTLPAGILTFADDLKAKLSNQKLVTILTQGRPRVIGDVPTISDAILHTFLPGPWGGIAVGEVLFGITNPSGRLPYSYPQYPGDQTLVYWKDIPDNQHADPLYNFGDGFGYSPMEYSSITASSKTLTSSKSVSVSVTVTNMGEYDGKEPVLMYVQQPYRKISPPTKLLKAFNKISLKKGQSQKVTFEVTADMFKYTGVNNVPYGSLDSGIVNIFIGTQNVTLTLQA
ncbi:hypothetical protein BZG36_02248 [Bifiguratus adelaidae]|uniref:beta-glucosidase n=1 Tax=Bifiguratus adelaidae TaxID=1938954 RepID=A0A261Y1M3_9FUNG|nr:hypothetical protein BZG36_02248 [Bifiguratus adelaidae]